MSGLILRRRRAGRVVFRFLPSWRSCVDTEIEVCRITRTINKYIQDLEQAKEQIFLIRLA